MRRKIKAALQGRFGKGSNRKGLKRPSAQRRSRLSFESLETRNLLAASTFQFGVDGYDGGEDTLVFSLVPDSNLGAEGVVNVDQQDFNNVRQGLMKFGEIFGDGPNQIPFGQRSIRRN